MAQHRQRVAKTIKYYFAPGIIKMLTGPLADRPIVLCFQFPFTVEHAYYRIATLQRRHAHRLRQVLTTFEWLDNQTYAVIKG